MNVFEYKLKRVYSSECMVMMKERLKGYVKGYIMLSISTENYFNPQCVKPLKTIKTHIVLKR